MEAAKKTDRKFCCYQSGAHTTRDFENDIKRMTTKLMESAIACEQRGRTSPGFMDPTDDGLHKLCSTDWIKTTLTKSPTQAADHLRESEDTQEDIDLNYELADIN